MANGLLEEEIVSDLNAFNKKFNELYSYYKLYNAGEIYDFARVHNGLVESLIAVKPLIAKYFPDNDCILEFFPDPEIDSFNQIVIRVDPGDEWIDDEFLKKLSNISSNIIYYDDFIHKMSSLFLVVL